MPSGLGGGFGPGFKKLRGLAAVVTGPSKPAMRRAGLVLEKQIKQELSQPGSGREYPSRKGRGKHQASAPGEPPAPDLGDLRRAIGTEEVGNQLRVGPEAPVSERASALEFGHAYDDGRVLAPRPFMRPALAKAEKKMTDEVVVGLQTSTRSALD